MEKPEDTEKTEDLLDLHEIMQAFGITIWENLGPEEMMGTSGLAVKVRLNDRLYILRERPEAMLGEDVTHRYLFSEHLYQSGIPVPTFYLAPDGEPYVTLGEDTFELQLAPEGERYSSTQDEKSIARVAAAGTMLGQIHRASQTYRGPEHHWPSETHIGGIVQSYLHVARTRGETHSIQAIAVGLSEWVDQYERVLPAAMMSIGAGRQLPMWHIHGDYHAHNLRFGNHHITAVLGLEASRWERRIFEVAYALLYFCALNWLPSSDVTRPLVKRGLDPELARQFLAAYGTLCPPVAGEANLLGDALWLVAPIISANGPLEDLFYLDTEVNNLVVDDVMERLAWASSLPLWIGRVRSSLAEMWR